MENIKFDGTCPQCLLYNEEHLMRANNKFWECPNCNLQILVENDKASVFHHRGEGMFLYNDDRFKGKVGLQEVGEDSYPNGIDITTEAELVKYLLLKVQQKEKYSIDNLIDSYVSYRFQGGSIDQYLVQSNHFKINFDDNEIEAILSLRDYHNKLSDQYSHLRLYRFLVDNVFPKYFRGDSGNLPEMGMSKLQMYLCMKHFGNRSSKIINSNPRFIKQALRSLIKDLISIIYFDEKVLLTGDLNEMLRIKQEMYRTSSN